LALQLEAELKQARLATKDDLDALEKRLAALIKGGNQADLSGLVKAGDALSAETQALDTAVQQNQPPQKG
jgi:hypothetical protein